VPDFWPSSGYRLLTRGADGRLTLTDDFLRGMLLRPELAGKPVYLGMAMDAASRLRLKPQNLLLNLPLARPQ
jgi:hypothetical protein